MPHLKIFTVPEATPPLAILVVEDEMLVRWAIADYLRENGFEVFEAEDVDSAKTVLAAEKSVAVLFTDVQMPGSADGFDLAIWVREHHDAVRVVVTSGWSGADKRAQSCGYGGPVISKPYDQSTVLHHIRKLLG